uniref:Ig-like domain-containing protein n=1 Tax=Pygocentrus nattereri TaxID=42514 RepID=A0A3B4C7P9_PYGNA
MCTHSIHIYYRNYRNHIEQKHHRKSTSKIQSLRQTISAELGASVSLQCSAPEKMSLVYWYKQSVGKKPQLLVTVPKYGSVEFYGEFKDNPRFMVARNSGIASLSISNTIPSDTAVYYCAEFNAYECFLSKPMSYQGRQGDSVNFQCTIHTNVSHGDHRVYWFRHGSGESHPGIIYTHGNRSDECEKSSETDSPTQSCVYKLPKRNLSLSDAGTYYCAVAACGQILFGNGSNLKVEGITWLISYKREEEEDTLNYAALNLVKKKAKSRRERKPEESVVVYSSVRCKNAQMT